MTTVKGRKTFYGRMADIFGLPGNVVRHPVCYNNSARCKRLWALFCSEFIKKAPTVAEKGPRSREESSVIIVYSSPVRARVFFSAVPPSLLPAVPPALPCLLCFVRFLVVVAFVRVSFIAMTDHEKLLCNACKILQRESKGFRKSKGNPITAAAELYQLLGAILPLNFNAISVKTWKTLVELLIDVLQYNTASQLLPIVYDIMGRVFLGIVVHHEFTQVHRYVRVYLAKIVGKLVSYLAKKDKVSRRKACSVLQMIVAADLKFRVSPRVVLDSLAELVIVPGLFNGKNVPEGHQLVMNVLEIVCSMRKFKSATFTNDFLTRKNKKPLLFQQLSINSKWFSLFVWLLRSIDVTDGSVKKAFANALKTLTDTKLKEKIENLLLVPEEDVQVEEDVAKENAPNVETKSSSQTRQSKLSQQPASTSLLPSKSLNQANLAKQSQQLKSSQPPTKSSKSSKSSKLSKSSKDNQNRQKTKKGRNNRGLVVKEKEEDILDYQLLSTKEATEKVNGYKQQVMATARLLCSGGGEYGGLYDANMVALIDPKELSKREIQQLNARNMNCMNVKLEAMHALQKKQNDESQYWREQALRSQQRLDRSQQRLDRVEQENDELRNNQSSSTQSFGGFGGVLNTPLPPRSQKRQGSRNSMDSMNSIDSYDKNSPVVATNSEGALKVTLDFTL